MLIAKNVVNISIVQRAYGGEGGGEEIVKKLLAYLLADFAAIIHVHSPVLSGLLLLLSRAEEN